MFPSISSTDLLKFQFSSWYPTFSDVTIKSTIIRPLPQNFSDYLNSDGVHIPEGADDLSSQLSDDEDGPEDSDSDSDTPHFTFPSLDSEIRACISTYGSVFPKLNFSSPKDASWILPASSPLKCTSPADVYMLLKSSDFITHDITRESVFEGCSGSETEAYELELVLRKWYPIDKSRELRCFVREHILIGISQRDTNYYEFLNDPPTCQKIVSSVQSFWETKILPKWEGPKHYTFDFLLTRDLSRGHILDFNPYLPKTDSLLFTYDDLHSLTGEQQAGPELRVIDSRSHPAATSNAPANQHNMIPFEALSLGSGSNIQEFAEKLKGEIEESLQP
ncbi:D123-domain-containing protein [Roridomyces roridus]|uniref:D123-domain-containing protein n=1 Tax=Roridomyces roridus TaxID=1738132 RepID=A0AAD7FYC3_9AGAR|nr:D123-domain-containing protein [Roridomyces roridus]